MTVKQRLEAEEKARFAPYAAFSGETKGREHPISPCDLRTEYQRDRDRIIHCKSFRRMKHKTQCFISPEGDHFRTRLTHTLEVSQIARTIARALQLNEDLCEAIAMGHDLGHTPFGHMGERILEELNPNGFTHEQQSIRVVEKLENDGKGLNLCWEVRDGILNHPKRGKPATLEGKVVSLADRIAYINHDIDDALRACVLTEDELPEDLIAVLGRTHGERIDTMILDIVNTCLGEPEVCMSPAIGKATEELRGFMFEKVYTRDIVNTEEEKAARMLRSLYGYYLSQPEMLPREFRPDVTGETPHTAVTDYIACMTDRYAVYAFEELFVPKSEALHHRV